MAEKANQHFVPKFYFRFFNGGTECIQVFCPRKNLLIRNAPIKGQCARHRMYGDNEIEDLFCAIETKHRLALKRVIDLAWSDKPAPLVPELVATIIQAVQFQRRRTKREADGITSFSNSFNTLLFAKWLESQPDESGKAEILERIQSGDVRVTQDSKGLFLESIATAQLDAELIFDLRICIIKNHSWFPFIFSDAPVVLHNSYYQNVKNRGVLGLTTPGLQIFYPLNSRTLLTLFDPNVYFGRIEDAVVLNINNPDDISQLNLLQLHNHSNSIYCGDPLDLGYSQTLWRDHRHSIIERQTGVVVRRGWLIDGKPVPEVIQQYERALDIRLDLSFIRCNPIAEWQYVPRRRDPAAYRDFTLFHQKRNRIAKQSKSDRSRKKRRH